MCAPALGVALPAAAQAGTANAGLPGAASNPIAHITWGVPHDDDLRAGRGLSGEASVRDGQFRLVTVVEADTAHDPAS